MKNIEVFLSDLHEQNIHITVEGERLRCKAPKGKVTPEIQAELGERKADIIQYLQQQAILEQAIQPISRNKELPVSFVQQRLWFLDQVETTKNATYNLPVAARLEGSLNFAALEQSLGEIIQRHETLRTTFSRVNGKPVPVIHKFSITDYQLPVTDLREISLDKQEIEAQAQKLIDEKVQSPFDLSIGPLIRTRLFQLGAETYILLINMHHIISDGSSMGIFIYELSELYQAFSQNKASTLPPISIQYVDFANWQQQWMKGDILKKQLNYWQRQLANAPELLKLPLDKPRPKIQTFRGDTQSIKISKELTQQIRDISKQSGTSIFMTLIAAFATLLRYYSGQEDIIIASPVANRNQSETESIIGFFVNALALRIDLSGNPSFQDLLRRTRKVCLEAYAHQDVPSEQILGALRLKRNLSLPPLTQVAFVFENMRLPPLKLPKLKTSVSEVHTKTTKTDLALYLYEESEFTKSDGFVGMMEYNTDIFDSTTIISILDDFQQVLAAIVKQPEYSISTLLESLDLMEVKQPTFEEYYPLSHSQRAMWFLYQIDPESGSGVYNVSLPVRIRSSLDIAVLQKTLNALINRHPCLRSTFMTRDNEVFQEIIKDKPVHIENINASTWTRDYLTQEVIKAHKRSFSPEQGYVERAILFSINKQDYIFLWSFYHLVIDAWSLWILMEELSLLYPAIEAGQKPDVLPLLKHSYADFVRWEMEKLASAKAERLWAYWQKQLAGDLPVLNLPTDHPHPSVQTYQGSSVPVVFNESLIQQVKELMKTEGTSLFVVLLAAFQILLYRYTGQEDIIVGSMMTNRTQSIFTNIVGNFSNRVLLRAFLKGDLTFKVFMDQVAQTVLGALDHQEYPFSLLLERLQPNRDTSRLSFLQVDFTIQKQQSSNFALTDKVLNLEHFKIPQQEGQFELDLEIFDNNESFGGSLRYNTDLFEATTIERMVGHFQTLLEWLVTNPLEKISKLSLLTETERQMLVEWNNTEVDYSDSNKCLHQLFEAQVEKTPDSVAVIFENEQLSYAELNQAANQVAHHLQRLGVKPEMMVGICIERSVEMVIGLLGILKAGGAYLPLDSTSPAARIAFLLEDASVNILLTQSSFVNNLPSDKVEIICLDNRDKLSNELSTNPISQVQSKHLAYMIYTSGSTGKPKGVLIEHRGVVNTIIDINQRFNVGYQDRILALSALNFDLSVYDIFGLLAAGGAMVIPAAQTTKEPAHWTNLIKQHNITLWNTVPALMQMLVDYLNEQPEENIANSLRLAMMSGDWIPLNLPERMKELWPQAELISLGGATEASIWSISYPIKDINPSWRSIPYGKPLANQTFYILDDSLQACPLLIPGYLYIGGKGLARGYWGDKEKTDASFIVHPILQKRLYKTGDLGRYLPDGNIEFLGRKDNQVKLRGFRIELGEIDAVLTQHPAVREVVTIIREDQPGNKRLVAYIVPEENSNLTPEELRDFLKTKLPNYMLPAVFIILEAFPLTPNGKVNRNALPAPTDVATEDSYIMPETDAERLIATVWQETLNIEFDKIGINNNFFDLGGHSLMVVQLQSKLQAIFDQDISIVELFEHPTIHSLAQYLKNKNTEISNTKNQADNRRSRKDSMKQRRKIRQKQRSKRV